MLKPADRWVWDFWLARDGTDYHIFYLQAPRSLGKEELRHWNVSIGHAVSTDLVHWEILPDALYPGSPGAWDDYTTWTGSVIRHEGTWYLFYTGTRRADQGLVQRIGLATSDDLIHWQRYGDDPLLLADPQYYELLDLDLWHDQAWRDPYVFRHPETGEFHAFITARANYGPPDERGVIAHASSPDLLHWEVHPPVTEPGDFGQLEVPQYVAIDGRHYILFCTFSTTHSAARCRRMDGEPVTGIHYLVSGRPLGPFQLSTDQFLVGDAPGSLYSGKLVQTPRGAWALMACRYFAPDGSFVGDLIDPLPVTVDPEGELSVEGIEDAIDETSPD